MLDVTRLTIDPEIQPVPSEKSIRDNFVPKNADVIEAAREQAELRFGPNLQSDSATSTDAAPLDDAVPIANSPEIARKETAAEPETELNKNVASRSRLASQQFAPAGVAAMAEQELDADDAAGRLCDSSVRESEDKWLVCIANLREAGLENEADQEYQALLLKFRNE